MFSNNKYKPAFEVRFLAENSILLITWTPFGPLFFVPQNFNRLFSNRVFFHPMGENPGLKDLFDFYVYQADHVFFL